MAVVYLRIEAKGHKYGKYCVDEDLIVKYGNLPDLRPPNLKINEFQTPYRRIKYEVNGIYLHILLRELINCKNYRACFIKYHLSNALNDSRILFELQDTNEQIIDYKWNEHLSYLVRERCELEHALSWLSTLGGAFSALGDYFVNFALVAGKISYRQLLLAIRMDDPSIVSRCKLYFSLSLIQRHKFKFARKIIEIEYDNVKNGVIMDTRLVKMCLGIWSKLQYEHQVYRETKKCKRLQIK